MPQPAKPIIFAVLFDGTMIEPIAHIANGKLAAPLDGEPDNPDIKLFDSIYYRPKAVYRLLFGGAADGSVTISNSTSGTECAPNMAKVTAAAKRAKLKGMVMALATNAKIVKPGSGVRRMPTPVERSEIESLVRDEFKKQNVDTNSSKKLRYHNLTALDVDNDKTAELVGSYWIEIAPKTRGLLFFIAEKNARGKYSFGFADFSTIDEKDVMSGEIETVDSGIYHEVLLDIFDYDGDGISEVFTYTPSFEGAGFNAYSRRNGKWTSIYEVSNYHCGY